MFIEFMNGHNSLLHRRHPCKKTFDFTRLNSESPEFNLIIASSEKFNSAVREEPSEVTGPVYSYSRIEIDELLSCKGRQIIITFGNTTSTDANLASNSCRKLSHIPVENMNKCVIYWFSYENWKIRRSNADTG